MAVIEILKWDAAPRVFAYKYPNVELSAKTQLIVAESQEAVLAKEGHFWGPFGPGRHVLNTQNYPFLTRQTTSFVSNGHSPFTAEVWFTQKAIPLDIKWGTMDPILVEDPKHHIMLPIKAFGQYGIQIINSKKFLAKLVGQLPVFVEKTLSAYFRGIIVTLAKDYIASYLIDQNISFFQIASKLNTISECLQKKVSDELDNYGLRVVSFTVNSISTDEKDPAVLRLKDALSKKAEMNIVGYTYQQERSFDTIKAAAENNGAGSLMNAGIGLGMGVGIGAPMGNMMGAIGQSLQTAQNKSCPQCGHMVSVESMFCPFCGVNLNRMAKNTTTVFIACNKCGTRSSKGTKFCPNCGDLFHCCPVCGMDNPENAVTCSQCGSSLPKKCPQCNALITNTMNFCNECGAPLRKICPNCHQAVDNGIKFCPNCGEKLI